MGRVMTLAAAAALVGATILPSTPGRAASAAAATAAPIAAPRFLHPVQFYGDDGWERRRRWREWRQDRDEARLAEAARREAHRIGEEREQHGYGPAYGYGHHRSW